MQQCASGQAFRAGFETSMSGRDDAAILFSVRTALRSNETRSRRLLPPGLRHHGGQPPLGASSCG